MIGKVAIIGLDGGTFRVIDYLANRGRLPNFAALMEKGVRAELMSSVPPITPAAWVSFYTGTNPGKNGTVDFFRWRPGTYSLSPVNTTTVTGEPLWSLASRHGRRVCVFNVPVTWPATPVNGIMVSGMDAPRLDEAAVYPAEFREELLKAIPDFTIESGIDYRYLVNNADDPTGEYIRLQNRHLDMETRAVRFLMGLEDWDLFVAVFRTPDAFQHIFWDSVEKFIDGQEASPEDERRAEAVFACYETLDRELAEQWAAEGRHLALMSDHGFGLLEREVCLNRVLEKAGLLKFHKPGARDQSRGYLKSRLQEKLPRGARQKLKKLIGRDDSDRKWDLFVDALVADIDWSATRICSVGQFGCLFVNLKGREPLGTVDGEDERQSVIAETERAMKDLVDPIDGQPIVTAVYRREDIFEGPLAADLPDLVVVMRDYAYRGIYSTRVELSEETLIRPARRERKELAHSGTHRREGILVLYGPDIVPSDLGQAEMVDVAPTIAVLLGLPALSGWDGSPLTVFQAGERAPADTIEYKTDETHAAASFAGREGSGENGETYSENDEEEVRRRLEDLGYL